MPSIFHLQAYFAQTENLDEYSTLIISAYSGCHILKQAFAKVYDKQSHLCHQPACGFAHSLCKASLRSRVINTLLVHRQEYCKDAAAESLPKVWQF
jgi:hypothetical protein